MAEVQRLTEAVEHIKDIIVARATGSGGSEADYRRLRVDLLAEPLIKSRLPAVVERCRTLDEVWSYIRGRDLPDYYQRRDFLRDEFDGVLSYLEAEASDPSRRPITESLDRVDSDAIRDTCAKALDRIDRDPEGAITAARTLLESVCKHILSSEGVPYPDDADLPKLYRLTGDQLRLSPSQHTEDAIKRILGGAQSVVEGLGTLRNRLSDSHGRGPKAARPAARHARLAVNMGDRLTPLSDTLSVLVAIPLHRGYCLGHCHIVELDRGEFGVEVRHRPVKGLGILDQPDEETSNALHQLGVLRPEAELKAATRAIGEVGRRHP